MERWSVGQLTHMKCRPSTIYSWKLQIESWHIGSTKLEVDKLNVESWQLASWKLKRWKLSVGIGIRRLILESCKLKINTLTLAAIVLWPRSVLQFSLDCNLRPLAKLHPRPPLTPFFYLSPFQRHTFNSQLLKLKAEGWTIESWQAETVIINRDDT